MDITINAQGKKHTNDRADKLDPCTNTPHPRRRPAG